MELDIAYIARLSRLTLTPEETKLFSAQLEKILEYIRVLQRLETAQVPPTTHPLPITNVFREDLPQPSLPMARVLQNAPKTRGGCFVVPQVIEPT